ncbi:MAG: GGDEF domain-containing protein [Actinobacteria bacterium]|nr:GGDEF domain-containing protein [Actinomycetota bacterium]
MRTNDHPIGDAGRRFARIRLVWSAAHRPLTRRRGGEPVDDLGVTYRFHYTFLAAFAACIGGIPLVLSFTALGESLSPTPVRLICLTGVLLAPALIFVPRAIGYRFHAPLIYGVLLYSVAAPFFAQQSMAGQQAAFQILYVAGPIGAAFYFTLRPTAPMALLSIAALLYMSGQTGEHEALLRAIFLAEIVVGGSLMVHFVKRRLAETIELNQMLAGCDPLTGTRNLHRFEQRLDEEISRANRGGGAFALIEFDLDNFKLVNDVHDHSTGDEVLIATADAIRSAFESPDMLVRRGGDEFVVIAPGADSRDLDAMVAEATERVEHARRWLCPDVTPSISSAIVVHEHGETADELFHRTDAALHDAKLAAPGRRGQPERADLAGSGHHPTPETPEVAEQRARRIDGASVGEDPIVEARRVVWKTAAWIILAVAATINVLALLDKTDLEFSPMSIALSLTWSAIFAPIVYSMSRRKRQPEILLHLLGTAALLLISFGCAISGDSAPALAETYLMAGLAIMAILPARSAFSYLAVMLAMYTTVLVVNDSPDALIRVANTASIMVLAGTILTWTRETTIGASRELSQLARTDALTGLPNTRRLTDRLEREIRRCKTTGGSLAMLMLDLDNFKQVNDLHSHAVGDEVLIAVAGAIVGTARHTDMAARRGGDEFAVILPDSDARDAVASRKRIADAIAEARESICPDIDPDASIGWVVLRPGETADELLARADGSLHLERVARRRESEHELQPGAPR